MTSHPCLCYNASRQAGQLPIEGPGKGGQMMRKIALRRGGALLLSAALLFSTNSLAVSAKAKSASVPPGITLTKKGLVTDQKTLQQAMEQKASGSSAAGTSKASQAQKEVLYSLTVLDADDLYYTRNEGALPLVVTAASGAVRFHNVKVGDPRSIAMGKLGEAFVLAASAENAGGIDFYQDAENPAYLLWIQYAADDTVQALVYQKNPAGS